MARLTRLTLLGIRFIVPWTIRSITMTLRMCFVAVASLWTGVPNACRLIASMYVERAIQNGFPTLYARYLYNAICVMAFVVIVMCWVVFAFATMSIVNWVI